jgi:hypothetical protein
MPDDPREILKAAGVDVPQEWNEYRHALRVARGKCNSDRNDEWNAGQIMMADAAGPAILALARLVAKYKWQRDDSLDEYAEVVDGEWGLHDDERDGGFQRQHVEDLELRWTKEAK